MFCLKLLLKGIDLTYLKYLNKMLDPQIVLKRETKVRLDSIGHKGDTYNDLLIMLLDKFQEKNLEDTN